MCYGRRGVSPSAMSSSSPSHAITLRWLLRLRWVAVAGQLAAMLVSWRVLRLDLPWMPLLGLILLVAFSNSMLLDQRHGLRHQSDRYLFFVLSGDIVLLTAMLYLTGGAHNPFSSFYLLFVALAAMALPGAWLAAAVALCLAGYAVVHAWFVPLRGPDGVIETGCSFYKLHLHGMAVAMVLTAVGIAVFVHRLQRAWRDQQEELEAARRREEETAHFASLATLATGVAHELGSPLGTIAVASSELESELGMDEPPDAARKEWLADAHLIRTEVDRCRAILDRLHQQTTSGLGEAARHCTGEEVARQVRGRLSAEENARLEIPAPSSAARWLLPVEPVLQGLVVLVRNALEASPSGSPVLLEIASDEGAAVFRVSDCGTGMTEEVRRRVGEPFFSTKAPRQGMGLGLYLVRTLAQRLHGSLVHEDNPGGGTRAILRLPSLPSALLP